MIIPGKKVKFDIPTTISVAFPGGAVYEFLAVVSIFKDEDGTLYIEKSNKNAVEIRKEYLFFEIGDSDE